MPRGRQITVVGLPDGTFVDGDSPEGKRAIDAFVWEMRFSGDPYWQGSTEEEKRIIAQHNQFRRKKKR